MVHWAAVGKWLGLVGTLFLLVAGCSSAERATVHKDDMRKVFPWPQNQKKISIRAKPQTTMANTCVWLGSYEDVEVTPETTFYITDETDKKFVYTPSRSPMGRLAPISHMEIRWPQKAEPATGSGEVKVAPPEKPVKKENKEIEVPEEKTPANKASADDAP